jgi:transmembrane 9 superfamily protein 3
MRTVVASRPSRRSLCFAAIALLFVGACSSFLPLASASAEDHVYSDNEDVILWANKVGPYHNPSETYPYYSIPGCPQLTTRPLQTQPDSLGVLLEGDTLVDTGIAFLFKREAQFSKICDLQITEEMVDQLEFIVSNHYWYQMSVDSLPLFGMIGEYITEEEMREELDQLVLQAKVDGESGANIAKTEPTAQGFIYTHRDFSISYNGAQIIEVNLTSENPRPITKDAVYPITYSQYT